MARPPLALELSRRGMVVGAAAGALAGLRPRLARAADSDDEVHDPLAALDAASVELATLGLDAEGWRTRAEAALSGIEGPALRAALGIDEGPVLRALASHGYVSRALDPAALPGLSSATRLRPKLFALARGRAILPHAHRHLLSVFVVLDGRVRGRHYDRVRDQAKAIVIRPSEDRELGPGAVRAIAELRDNVHWFEGIAKASLLFNCSVPLPRPLRRELGPSGRMYIDPEGEALDGGLIRAPRSSLAALRAKYETR